MQQLHGRVNATMLTEGGVAHSSNASTLPRQSLASVALTLSCFLYIEVLHKHLAAVSVNVYMRECVMVIFCKQFIPFVTQLQVKYSWFMHGLAQDNIQLNRKMLSELAVYEPHSFKALVEQVQFMRGYGSKQDAPVVSSVGDRFSVGMLEQQTEKQEQQ